MSEEDDHIVDINMEDEDSDDLDTDEEIEKESEDDSMDDEGDVESKLIKKYLDILQRIDENKYNYEDYSELVSTAHLLTDLDKIRQSYELFSAIYPLSPEIWMKWLNTEMCFSTSDEEQKNVQNLFERSLGDYFSSTVAYEYGLFALKCTNKNEIFGKILPIYTLSCLDGAKLYSLWRDDFIKSEPESPEKLQKLIKTYENELKLPLNGMENNYIEFKLLIEKNKETIGDYDYETFERRYNRAKEALNRILPYETKITSLDAKMHKERVELYLQYIKECEDCLDDNFLQAVYEKMMTDCCLSPPVWQEYLKFFDLINDDFESDEQTTVFSHKKIDIINRALRNCPWSSELHIEKLRILEKSSNTKHDDYKSAFEQSIAMGFNAPEPYVELWLEYLTYLRRNTDFLKEHEVDRLRKNFSFAWNSLGQQWGVLADQNCEILQFWGRLEYGSLNDPLKGRELWTTVMESGDNSTKSGMWIEFVNLEVKRSVDAARKIFKKTFERVDLDNLQTIVYAWIGFERCYGTASSLKSCQKACNEILIMNANRIRNERRMKREDGTSGKKPHPVTKRPHTDSHAKGSHADEKRLKFDENTNDVDPSKDNVTVFVSNLDYNITEDEVSKIFEQLKIVKINLIRNAAGRGRGFGYVEFASENDVKQALDMDRIPLNGRPTYISSCLRDKSKREKFKFSESLEPSKLFVKGIAYEATKEDLEELFGKYGKLKDVRIVYHKNGKSKGIAYIEYEKEKSASDAVMKLDQKNFRDHMLHVAISQPPPYQGAKNSTPPILKTFKGLGRRTNRDSASDPSIMKPRMSFIPQSVQKKMQITNNGGAVPAPEELTKKTNEDFRKMILNKK